MESRVVKPRDRKCRPKTGSGDCSEVIRTGNEQNANSHTQKRGEFKSKKQKNSRVVFVKRIKCKACVH
jgi:hypothetical protein